MRSNCLIFVCALVWRRGIRRSRVTARVSHYGPFLHFLYGQPRKSGQLRLVSYVPIDPKRKLLPPLLFRGRVKWGDL